MARLARLVIPGLPYHVTQRGNRRGTTFFEDVMDEAHLAHAARYVALNPVRARLCERAVNWPWSSARAHLAGRDDRTGRGRAAV